jgi:hypothetical protein
LAKKQDSGLKRPKGIRGLFLASSERMKRLSFKKLIIVPPILTYFLDLYHTNKTGTRKFLNLIVAAPLIVKVESIYAISPSSSHI